MRAIPGTGSVYKDNTRGDRWFGKITIDGQVRRVTARTKTDARTKLNELIRNDGVTPAEKNRPNTIAVATVVDDFLKRDLASRGRGPSTIVVHEWAARLIKKHLGKKPVAKLTVRQVDDMLDALAEEGLSRSALVKVRNTLSQALRYAVKRQDIATNVAADATIPASAPRAVERVALSPADARELLDALRHERNGLLFALSLRLGLRPGEAAGLYWSDIGDEAVNVTRGVRLSRGRAEVVDDLKTSESKRTIALPTDLVDWFADHRKNQIAELLAAGSWVDERLVFTTPTGNVTDPKANRVQLAEICEEISAARREVDPEAEVFPTIKPNELRHSCASLLSDEGVPNELIADLLGHTTTRMVDTTYRHRLRPVIDVASRADWASSSARASQ